MPKISIAVPGATEGYVKSKDGSHPRTLRVTKAEGDILGGWCLGQYHEVNRVDYEKMSTKLGD